MLIAKSAVREFLNRPRKDYRHYLDMSDAELDRRMRKLPVRPPIWNILNHTQKVGLIIAAKTYRFCFWNDMGTGKTLLATAICRYFIKLGDMTCGLLLLPNKINKTSFARDVAKLSPQTKTMILSGSSATKWEQLETKKGVHLVIETYAGLVRMVTVEKKRKKKKDKMHLAFSKPLVRKFMKYIDGIFMDESIMVIKKNRHGSLMHRFCRKLGHTFDVVFALNGTPFGRDPADMWGQMYIVDKGASLGETLGLFRAAFYKSKQNYWGGWEHTFDKKKEKLLHDMMANGSIRFMADEKDLPDVRPRLIKVDLAEDAETYFEKVKHEMTRAHGNYQEMKNAFIRMRQLSSGFLGYVDDELGTKAKYEFKPNPKLDRLLKLIDAKKDRGKIIVFHDFVFTGSMISRELEERGIGHVRLYGKTKDPDAVLDQFDNDKKCRVFLLNSYAGAFNLNLQIAKYGVVYESPVPSVTRRQIERRFIRQHSPHDYVMLYDFIVRGTFDERILEFHRTGKELFKAIVDRKIRL